MDIEREEYFLDLLEGDQNDPNVQYEIGRCYLQGDGTEPDGARAEQWLQKAAAQGQEDAIALLNPPKQEKKPAQTVNPKNLMAWCAAAEDGDPEAQYRVAIFFRQQGDPRTRGDVERYLTMAAAQGHPMACTILGRELLEKNPREAIRHLKNAADCGEPKAMELLGRCCTEGIGLPKNQDEALRWFEAAAQRGTAEDKLRLALRFRYGEGVPSSLGRAMKWINFAQLAGMADAKERFDQEIENRENQKKEAERRIREAAARAEAAKREAAARAEAEKREKERLQAEEAERREKQRREEEAARQEKLRQGEEARRTLEIYKREQEARRLEKQERLEAERRYHQPRQRDTANKASLFQSAWAQGGQLIQKLLDQDVDKAGEEECRQRPFERRPQTQQMREELNRQSMLANWIKQAEERNRPIPMPADLVTRARAGDPEAQWRLGTCYYLGHRDFSTNYARFLRAAYWFQKSAEQGYALGQFDYGNCFACGAGVEKDLNTAAQWWEKAAIQDLSMARKILTHCWYNRDQRVVKVDDLELLKTDTYYMTKFYCPPLTAEAVQERDRQNKLYEKIKKAKFASAGDKLQILIDRGDLDAIAFVGYCCRYGESGFERDIPKGVALLKRAAEENYMFAQWCYGNCFATGAGVEQDLDAAAMWWRKAADQGSELACNSLNHCRFDFTDHVIGLDGLHLRR